MLRVTFLAGYAVLLIGLIAFLAIKVIALGFQGPWSESPLLTIARTADAYIDSGKNLLHILLYVVGFIAVWLLSLWVIAKRSQEWEKSWVKTLFIGGCFMMCFFLLLAVIGLIARYAPGIVGESAAKLAGMMSTPVIMESSFFFIGLSLLFAFNYLRRRIEGDDFVEMEIED